MSIGLNIRQLQTPALLVNLDIMEANLLKMAGFFENKSCKLRPHFKNLKCIELAKMQLENRAIGITTATLEETEALVKAGVDSILIANEIAGEANLKKLLDLAANAEIILAVDSHSVVEEIARLSIKKPNKLGLVIDIDLGMKRCGTTPGEPVLTLAKLILKNGLRFRGIMGYEGHLQRFPLGEETTKTRSEALDKLINSRDLLIQNNIPVEIISTGGTGSYAQAGTTDGITEVQAGNYLFMDTSYAPFAPDFKPSLSLLSTVISVSEGERFIVNAGVKEISSERGMPALKNMKGASLEALHAEHGIVTIQDKDLEIKVGDMVELDIYYSDATVNLHSRIYGIRGNVVEKIFETI